MRRRKIESKIRELSDKIIKEYKPLKVILFGSYAWGIPRRDSDVDLFIIKDEKKKSRLERMREVDEIISKRDIPVDILVYTPKEVEERRKLQDPFFVKILNSGKTIYESE